MRPMIVPASSRNGGAAIMVASVLPWVFEQFGIKMSVEVAVNLGGLIVLVVMHFTPDSPSPQVAREAVADAAEDAEMDAAERKR